MTAGRGESAVEENTSAIRLVGKGEWRWKRKRRGRCRGGCRKEKREFLQHGIDIGRGGLSQAARKSRTVGTL